MVASRSRHHLQRALPPASGEHGHRRGRLRSGEPLAESVRRTRDRLNPPRVLGPCDRAQCITSATHPHDVRALLSSKPDSPGAGEGCAGSAAGVTVIRWTDRRDSGSGRASSPLRTEGRVAPPPAPACDATVPSAHPCTQLVSFTRQAPGALASIARQLTGRCPRIASLPDRCAGKRLLDSGERRRPLVTPVSRAGGPLVSVSRCDCHGHPVRPNLFSRTEGESQPRLRRSERGRHAGRRAHLARHLHALRSGLLRR